MDKPLVSICCITYNHENFIRDAIEGFLMQKTTFPIEVIIHDDASTDNTAQIIKEYTAQHPKLITPIIQTENQYSKGIKPFNNHVLPRAKGKYIAVCEGDDYWTDPLKLQKQVDFLEENPEYSMCFHNAIIYETSPKGRNVYLFNDFTSDCDLTINDIVCKWVVPTASIMYRKKYLEYPDWMVRIYSGDYVLLLNLFLKGKIRYIDSISSVYRKNLKGNSVSTTVNSNFVRSQHILLLESFNKGTNRKYDKVVSKRINYLKKEIALRDAIWQHKYYKLILLLPQLWNNRLKIFK